MPVDQSNGAPRRNSRKVLGLLGLVIVAAMLAYAFWPRPTLVDIGTVTTGPMRVTIDEEGYTRLHDAYVLSTPVTGRLMRVEVEPGDAVEKGVSVVAQMRPTSPAVLDVRTREQARASVDAAGAALRVAEADVKKALADRDLAQAALTRTQRLFESGIVSEAALESAQRSARLADATLDTARAAVSMRVAEKTNAEALLLGFDDPGLANAAGTNGQATPLYAPATGTILRVMQQSETTLPAGTPILEVGNIDEGLEVRAELLSTDAVQIRLGDEVLIDNWGGPHMLTGTVSHITPWGFTKVSALGVEEQRIAGTIDFTVPPEQRAGLGHGYRVEVRIITWADDAATIVPAGALVRQGNGWIVFTVEDDKTVLQPVEIAANNGLQAAISKGVEPDQQIVLYPPSGLEAGQRVAQRTAY